MPEPGRRLGLRGIRGAGSERGREAPDVVEFQLRQRDGLGAGLRGGSTAAIRRGIDWTAGNYSVSANPRKAPGFSHLHWFAAVARAGALLGLERFGAHEWYAEGADALLAAQQPDGAWRLEDGAFMARERRDVLDTCLAILYLRRQ